MTDTETKVVEALREIKARIGDLQKLKDQAVGEGRKWALDAVWTIAHNTLLDIEQVSTLSSEPLNCPICAANGWMDPDSCDHSKQERASAVSSQDRP